MTDQRGAPAVFRLRLGDGSTRLAAGHARSGPETLLEPGLDIALAGGPAFYGDIQTVSEDDLRRSELISLPLAAVALLFVFGSVIAAGVPVVVGGIAVTSATVVIYGKAEWDPVVVLSKFKNPAILVVAIWLDNRKSL